MAGASDHVVRNRLAWDQWAADYAGLGLHGWAEAEPSWGIWSVPEAQAGVLPAALDGCDIIELGCGTGYVSAWLARRGARPVGLDNSAAQLATARALQQRFGLRFPLVHASAEQAPFTDASFDVVISEYGASIWCDPYAWIPEAARLLRAHVPRVRFAIIGDADDEKGDALSADDRERARAAGVRFLGRRFDMTRLYAGMDVHVLASHREGFPRSPMEAAAMCLPVVATNIRGCREVVDDGVTGRLVAPRDPRALAAAIGELADDRELRLQFATAGRAKAMREFDDRRCVEITLQTYRRLLAGRASSVATRAS